MRRDTQNYSLLGFVSPIGVVRLREHYLCVFRTKSRFIRRPQCPARASSERMIPALLAEAATEFTNTPHDSSYIVKNSNSTLVDQGNQNEAHSDKKSEQPLPKSSRRALSLETRQKISNSMLGVPKSPEMRAKLSASMKKSMEKRQPWNKGKTMSAETRKRMSISRKGRAIWNKGKPMSDKHKQAISVAKLASNVRVSDSTRKLLQLARRRPSDGIVAATGRTTRPTSPSGFPLVDTNDIHSYVSLRRSLRGWSDAFSERNGHRPTIADVRRTARPDVIRQFEQYIAMRGAIRGLAADVCGSVNPADIPVVPSRNSSSTSPQNGTARRVHITGHGNRRLASEVEAASVTGGQGSISFDDGEPDASTLVALGVSSTRSDMWDAYDAPLTRPSRASGFGVDRTLVGVHSLSDLDRVTVQNRLSAKDYRTIGKFRLLESKDINKFVQLRRELESWSSKFKEETGEIPKLSDVWDQKDQGLYAKFCRYLDMRHSMSGLMKEVYGASIEQLESTYDRLSEEAQCVLDLLQARPD